MATTNLGLPLRTHGHVALQHTVREGFIKIDQEVGSLKDAIPQPQEGDAGKFVVVRPSEDGFELVTVIPAFTEEDAGKVLAVNAEGDGLEWISLES